MRNIVRAARTPVLLLGSVIAIEGTYLAQKYIDLATSGASSGHLLYSKNSPFQADNFLTLTSNPAPRTELAVRTPITPFGVGMENLDGTFEHTVCAGETLISLWQELGGERKGGLAALKAFSDAKIDTRGLKAGEKISVTRKAGEIVEFKRVLGDGATLILVGNSESGYAPRIEQGRVVQKERKATGVIMSSLVDTAQGLSLPYALVDDFVDLFSNRVEFRKDLQPGDTFSVIFDERLAEDGSALTPGAIKAASLQLGGKLFAVVRDVAPDGTVRYFDEKGEMPGKYFLRYPVKFTRISSVFSTARFHPVLNVSRPHNGVDFSAPTGTAVRTVGDGTVTFSGFKSSTGNMVRIAHGNRYVTEYMHLSKIESGIKVGERVARGELIGAVGETGLATGPHLHFGMFDSGKYVDPLKSNLLQSEEEIKPPAAVLAMIQEIKKTHEIMTVASASSDKRA
jgi:murein DD-endopeptidase MepM/ murein hydrolase activator NlpD